MHRRQFYTDGHRHQLGVQSMPCGSVLFGGLLVSKRERAMSCGKLFNIGQR